ncbi:MAG: thioredoxin family protein [Saprospiraceae bacterium]|nr:thioredoxin family protein [Saprospiraceae bacterium]MBK8295841.1 thioredoxin family protein [Saprospiraceae bacterium]
MRSLVFSVFTLFILIGSVNSQAYQIGQAAEDFSLKNVDGKMVSLSDYKNAKGYIVVFTCNHCPFAQMYEKRIIELHKKYSKKGYPVIAINPNDPEVVPEDNFESMQKLSNKKKYPFAYLFDEGQKVYPKFGATRTPHVFILDKNKVVKYIGAIDDNAKDEAAVQIRYVEDAISALESGKDPNPNTTKAVGCSIKKKA